MHSLRFGQEPTKEQHLNTTICFYAYTIIHRINVPFNKMCIIETLLLLVVSYKSELHYINTITIKFHEMKSNRIRSVVSLLYNDNAFIVFE